MAGGSRTNPPEPLPLTSLLGQMTQVLAQMAQRQANQNNQGNQRVNIKEFLSLGHKHFVSTREPLDVDDWIRDMSKALEIAHMAEEDKVHYVTYLFKGQSASCWDNFQAMGAPGVQTTWDVFKEA